MLDVPLWQSASLACRPPSPRRTILFFTAAPEGSLSQALAALCGLAAEKSQHQPRAGSLSFQALLHPTAFPAGGGTGMSGHPACSGPAPGRAGGWTQLCHQAQVWPWPHPLKPKLRGQVPKRPRLCPPLLSLRAVGLTGWTGFAAARLLGKATGTPAERRRETLPKRAKLPLPPRLSQEQGEALCPGEPGWRRPRAGDPTAPQPAKTCF